MNEQTHSSKSSVSYSNHNLVSKSDGDSPTLTYSIRVEAATGTAPVQSVQSYGAMR